MRFGLFGRYDPNAPLTNLFRWHGTAFKRVAMLPELYVVVTFRLLCTVGVRPRVVHVTNHTAAYTAKLMSVCNTTHGAMQLPLPDFRLRNRELGISPI